MGRETVRTLDPGYLAVVMATGTLSVAMRAVRAEAGDVGPDDL